MRRRSRRMLGDIPTITKVQTMLQAMGRAEGSMAEAERLASSAGLPRLAAHFRRMRSTVDAMREEIAERLRTRPRIPTG